MLWNNRHCPNSNQLLSERTVPSMCPLKHLTFDKQWRSISPCFPSLSCCVVSFYKHMLKNLTILMCRLQKHAWRIYAGLDCSIGWNIEIFWIWKFMMGIPVNWNADFISIIGGKMQMHFSLRDVMHLWRIKITMNAFVKKGLICNF